MEFLIMKLCIPRLRIYQNPLSPTNQGCMLVNDKKIQNYCKKIIKALNIDGVCDFDIILKDNREPKIIDASCRLSGSATASLAAGINIPQKLINLLSGKILKNTKFNRNLLVFPQNRFELAK
jgi:predicted ATP-grasp superfamily ATP-dependent carboligase